MPGFAAAAVASSRGKDNSIGLRRLCRAQDYYSSGADDELTYNENVNAFQRIWLKPRILVNVADISISSEILGHATKFPVYLSAVAMCGMGHAKGEVSWVQAAARAGVVFMVPNLSATLVIMATIVLTV